MKKSKSTIADAMVTSAFMMQGAVSTQSRPSITASPDDAIHPFHIQAPEEELIDLKRRLL